MSEGRDIEMECAATFLEQMEIMAKRGKHPLGFGTAAWCNSPKIIFQRQQKRESDAKLNKKGEGVGDE